MSELDFKRVKALMIDLIVVGVFTTVVIVWKVLDLDTLLFFKPYPYPVKIIFVGAVILFLYDFLSTLIKKSTTGHTIMDLEVKFEVESFVNVYIRSIIKTLSILSVFLGLYSLYMMLKNEDSRTVHDMISRSTVWIKSDI